MANRWVYTLASLGFAIAALAANRSEEHSLLPNVKIGDKFVYEFEAVFGINGADSSTKSDTEMSVSSLEPKGTITFTNDRKEGEFRSGERVQKAPPSVSKAHFKVTGELLSLDPVPSSSEAIRAARMMQMTVPAEPATVGKSWSWKEEAKPEFGSVGREGEGQCTAFENRLGTLCAKVVYKTRETSGEKPASLSMVAWLSLKDGLPIEVLVDGSQMPFAPGVSGSVKATNRRRAK